MVKVRTFLGTRISTGAVTIRPVFALLRKVKMQTLLRNVCLLQQRNNRIDAHARPAMVGLVPNAYVECVLKKSRHP